jgi:pyruvate kinase
MNCARINCAHDTILDWEAMIENVRRAEAETGYNCKVLMDLGGPKPRTGQVVLPLPQARLYPGELLFLSRNIQLPPSPHYRFQAGCSLPEIFDRVQTGATVWIDDGKLKATVERILPKGLELRVTQTGPKGFQLKPDKGLNFPDTVLDLSPLTDKDYSDLDFIATHADIVGYSFVQEVGDLELLKKALEERLGEQAQKIAIVAKVETQQAVQNLPELIVAAAGNHPFGVMIARGDLAVEIGYQRLAEIQEEILWLCEAAHIPVVWATQVLENLVSKGTPSRAEMTDAAMAERAECVMLNKGPFVSQAITILDDVLTRMQDHQMKKTPQLRALRVWQKQG